METVYKNMISAIVTCYMQCELIVLALRMALHLWTRTLCG
jgi:hypothetical protein